MSDLRFNSIAGAVLASVLGVMAVGIGAETLIHPNYPEEPGFMPDVDPAALTGEGGGGGAAPTAEPPPDFGLVFADAAQLADNVARGERLIAQCTSCHTFDAGGANRIGPNLHDAFGRVAATHAGFEYSDAMHAFAQQWNYTTLDEFLRSPSQTVRGTKMAFAGIRRGEDRMAVIAYLRSISPNNVPLPAPLPAQTAEAAPAEGEAPADTTPSPAQSETPPPPG